MEHGNTLRREIRTALCTVATLLCPMLLQGQAPTGQIHLEVKDPSGAVLEASGKLVSLAPAGAQRSFQTDTQGTFTLENLPFGRYRLEVSKAGFAAQSVLIDVQSGTPISRTVTLALGAQASKVDVVATTPLHGVDLPLDEIPSQIQTATQADIQNSSAIDLADFMNRRLNGVYVNEMQDNPFQPDVNYRGFTASPLLGTPEGLSVYVDGVRQNQPFGDVVSWDLIQRNTVSEMALMPGSNPVFGLNTLGGAISVTTKDGVSFPGLSGQILYGSSGRKSVDAEYGGGKATGFNYYLAGNAFHESGWRFDSPSDVKQGFVKLGWRTAKTDFALTSAFAYNTLTGNGIQDYRLLQTDYSSVYSIPDTTGNRSPSFNFIAKHSFSNTLTFSGNVWYRYIRTEEINGNANNDAFNGPVYHLNSADRTVLTADGYTGLTANGMNASNTPYPSLSCIANAQLLADPDETCDAANIYSREAQSEFGASGQLTWITNPRGFHNQLTVGGVLDRGTVHYTQNTQYGYLLQDGAIVGVPAWEDGSTSAEGSPVNSAVNLRGITPNGSIYITDTFSPIKGVTVTAAGRFNRATINNSDILNPAAGPGSLTGDYTYTRFDPSLGFTYNPLRILNLYANYSQANRAPTSIELGCADPNNPCSLPNALSSDPPLSQVVTTTWEAGLRGKSEQFHFDWDLGAFRAENRNDILFVASQETGSGYFQNFAKTLREGVQASLDGHFKRVDVGLDYTFLSATYQSTETLDGTANNTSDIAQSGYPGVGGVITVNPGNRIPLIPKTSGKAFMDIHANKKFVLDLGLVANSSAYVRGNENNAYQANGVYYLGPGVSPGYAIVNFAAHYDLTRHLQLAAQVDNLLDHHYYTAGQIENTPFANNGTLTFRPFPMYTTGPEAGNYPLQSATFFAPGAPRRAWIELKLRF
jgi:outer membrane receptor protein involved in Fe transport